MRKDMHKVLTERTRVGKYSSGQREYRKAIQPARPERRYYHDVEVDTSPKRESIRRPHLHRYAGKDFADLINPLRRYLASQVGRPWDKVWSEICQVLKGNGLQANHVKNDHVKSEIDGIPHSGKTFFGHDDWHRPRGPGSLYVDRHGILRKSPERTRKPPRKKYRYKRESDLVEYHSWRGGWFRVEISYWEEAKKTFFGTPDMVRHYEVKSKRQLSAREVAKLKLTTHYETRPPKVTLK